MAFEDRPQQKTGNRKEKVMHTRSVLRALGALVLASTALWSQTAALAQSPTLRVGVLHAFGDHFTAGLDLPAVADYMKRGEKAIPQGLVEPHDFGLEGYRRRTKPMVVAVKGICFTCLLYTSPSPRD